MEQHEIEAFLTLADELHFGRTAERLHLSTARISQTIKKLERGIGAPLFERTSRRVALTPIGRQLQADLRPAIDRIQQARERAVAAARGIDGVLRVGFVGAAAGRFVLQTAHVLHERAPGCEVQVTEIQQHGHFAPLRRGDLDLLFDCHPVDEPDLVTGPTLLHDARMLAVSSGHPFARRTSVSMEDLADQRVLRVSGSTPGYWDEFCVPRKTPAGRPIERGPATETFQEMLAFIGAGHGVHPVGAQATRYYTRPDVAYVPIHDAPPFEWGLIWRASGETHRIRAFNQAALQVDEVPGRLIEPGTSNSGPDHTTSQIKDHEPGNLE